MDTFNNFTCELISRSPRRALFVGVDGEGGDYYGDGGHYYLLLRAGEHVLETGYPLTSLECLRFLADLPKGCIYVGYYFDYDVTMIIKDLPPERLQRLLNPDIRRKSPCSPPYPIDWGEFQIDYMPHKEFRVRRRAIGQPWTIINDVGSFFQEAFAKLRVDGSVDGALAKWFPDADGDLKEKIQKIAEGKGKRSQFGPITEYERKYNQLEVELLAEMMERLRETCDRVNLRPTKWQGPGQLVTAFFKREKFPKITELLFPDNFLEFANSAFYGGRFECCQYGKIAGPIYQLDKNSAYASYYSSLPCLRHGKWERTKHIPEDDSTYVADVSFRHPSQYMVNTLPVRVSNGTLIFPHDGQGIYWSPEINTARQYDARIQLIGDCWVYHNTCNCQPFKTVYELYNERKRLGSSTQGRPIKLLLAALYGKLAQTVGCAPYASSIWAGLITSYTRAMLADAALCAHNNASDVIMLATDGLFTRDPRPQLPQSDKIGDWTVDEHDWMLAVQSGVYITDKLLKTRGMNQNKIREYYPDLEHAWMHWLLDPDLSKGPTVSIPLHQFIGVRLAMARNKPHLAGTWLNDVKELSYDWETKRTASHVADTVLITDPIHGSVSLRSLPYDRSIGNLRALERLAMEDQPDWGETL